jgi:hypothetical protein
MVGVLSSANSDFGHANFYFIPINQSSISFILQKILMIFK